MARMLEGPAHDLPAMAVPGHGLRPLWHLDPQCHFLNHGSFGATPRQVLHAQDGWRLQMEQQPVRFMGEVLPAALRNAADRLAAFLGTQGAQLGFVENTTAGINAILRSYPWKSGDAIVLADHAYQAVRNTVQWLVQQSGVEVQWVQVPYPLHDANELAQAYCDQVTDRTRVVLVDHVFSPLAVVTPLHAVIDYCKQREVTVVIDGAHGPGMLSLALDALGADWYVGNCHKWLCAPKGSAFVHRGVAARHAVHPAVISNFFDAGFTQEFDWQGTRDYSAWLSVPAALDFLEAFGVERYQQFLREQAGAAAQRLCERWQVQLPAPADAFAGMVTIPWPGNEAATPENAKRLHDGLWSAHRIEVPVIVANGQIWVRISAQIYNEMSDYEALADALSSSQISL
jgi:isopenicillin-N epimerase